MSFKTTCKYLLVSLLILIGSAVVPTVLTAGPEGTGGGFGFGGTEIPDLTIRLRLEGEAEAGRTAWLLIDYDVPDGTHMTATFQGLDFQADSPASFGEAVFPEPDRSGDIHFYHGDLQARVPVEFSSPGRYRIDLSAEYQLCREGDAGLCFAPAQAVDVLEIDVAAGQIGGNGLQDRLQRALEQGSWLAFLLVFLGGVLASFTPCVYPMIPITISYIGGNAGGNPLKGFVMAVWYVLGIAIVYSVLGVLAAATGGAFGQATQTPVFAGSVAAVIGLMGLSMAGLFDIRMPGSLTSKIGGGRTGFLGPLLMGMAMGLIAAPCVGPILIVLLTWVATTGKLLLGFWLLFTFALGLGMLFLALGTFSGLMTSLPGAGGWMNNVKHGFAIALYALALGFLKLYLPLWLLVMIFGLAISLSAGAWGVFEPLSQGAGARAGLSRSLLKLLWLTGAMLALLGSVQGFLPGLLPATTPVDSTAVTAIETQGPEWIHEAETGFTTAAEAQVPVMMDFWAEWCAACLELDHQTYNQAQILALAKQFISIKMDMTESNADNDEMRRRYSVIGMPTVIFLAPDGRELERFSGYRKPEEMAEIMQRVLNTVQNVREEQ